MNAHRALTLCFQSLRWVQFYLLGDVVLRVLLMALCFFAVAQAAIAKTMNFPAKQPLASVTIPDKWKIKSIEYGFEAKSPNDDIYFSVETARGQSIDKMVEGTDAWMRDNKIVVKPNPEQRMMNFGGLEGFTVKYQATDENGPTVIALIFMTLEPSKEVVLMTFWGSEAEQAARQDDINIILSSIKALN